MKQCERCLKLTDGKHNCVPTEYSRKLEAELSRLSLNLMGLPFTDGDLVLINGVRYRIFLDRPAT